MIATLASKLTSPTSNRRAGSIFCKALFAYFGIKVLLTWSVAVDITSFHRLPQPKSLVSWIIYGPGALGAQHIHVFFIVLLVAVISALILRPNYFMSALIVWLAFNFYRLILPVANGSDQVLVSLLFLSILLSVSTGVKNELGEVVQSGLYNAAKLFCKFYIVSIYLISGLDKLGSEAWRSGEAIASIGQLDYMINPHQVRFIPESAGAKLVLSWITILFELVLPVLIWFRQTRKWILLFGILFHLIIGLFLSLFDFATIMIVSYLIFLNDEDYKRFPLLMKR